MVQKWISTRQLVPVLFHVFRSSGGFEQFIVECTIINNYWMRLSGISRIIEAGVGVICRSRMELFTWNYLSFILCTNYSLELFSFILSAKRKTWNC